MHTFVVFVDATLREKSPCFSNPCENGGNCSYVRKDYFCTCPKGNNVGLFCVHNNKVYICHSCYISNTKLLTNCERCKIICV